MTLHTLQPPPGALRAVLAALGSETALRQPAAAVLRHSPGPLLPAHPLAVYVLDGPADRLTAARRTGWRFLVRHTTAKSADAPLADALGPDGPGEVMAAAEVVESVEGHVFSHFTAGPYLDSTVRALRQAWQLSQAAYARLQPRLLSLPGHYATALWLHGAAPGEDLLIPLAPAPLGVTAHQVYPAAELLARLVPAPVAAPTALIG
ncbi:MULTISPECIES: hypothetical protein [Kitasatospora]|uniref:Uncharacterized protein n=2 Tax=Kitasatospora TaxID=2063 RepID=A0ABT1J410_9ACTN|nr:hypothetical protein [Kitasatospora paracochleata]MCP2312150.1 hypothetical protein [Kitasatospora paracochleata]